eukprot:TRINITY_DN3801_c1_g1_i1.p1 TRINITY_DN3801_c1_g1~~TRINITY_DN3801_c1_g1_i1.p1  ORF type:complete len:507 (+),score=82.65 TRINITY_DN3801_c1_g1_i1:472-1992(+)
MEATVGVGGILGAVVIVLLLLIHLSSRRNAVTALASKSLVPMLDEKYTLSDVAQNCTRLKCWIVLHGVVYDVTEFLDVHPGSAAVLLNLAAGRDATSVFDNVGHSAAALTLAMQYRIGTVVSENDAAQDDAGSYVPSATPTSGSFSPGVFDGEPLLRQLTTAFSTANTPAIVADAAGRIISWNQAAERLFLYTASDMIGSSITRIMPPYIAKSHNNYIHRHIKRREGIVTGGELSPVSLHPARVSAVAKDGTKRVVSINLSGFSSNGRVNFFNILSDMTEAARMAELKDRLVDNLLPKTIARQLVDAPSGQLIAEQYPAAAVYFSDIVSFTVICSSLSPKDVIEMLNSLFTLFDALVGSQGLEKIKTIGDSYMVVGGLPGICEGTHKNVAIFALEAIRAVHSWNKKHAAKWRPLQIRSGMHIGPLMAGVVGVVKHVFDCFGDTVNVASRMESSGIPMAVQTSQDAYFMLREFEPHLFRLVERGTVEIKGKGNMKTYLLEPASPLAL